MDFLDKAKVIEAVYAGCKDPMIAEGIIAEINHVKTENEKLIEWQANTLSRMLDEYIAQMPDEFKENSDEVL